MKPQKKIYNFFLKKKYWKIKSESDVLIMELFPLMNLKMQNVGHSKHFLTCKLFVRKNNSICSIDYSLLNLLNLLSLLSPLFFFFLIKSRINRPLKNGHVLSVLPRQFLRDVVGHRLDIP